MDDLISRQMAIDALWKALYEYEDKTEKQFLESEELDIADWFQHRIFVQNMSDIDRLTLLNLPPAQSEQDGEVSFWKERAKEYEDVILRFATEKAKGIKLDSIEITGERIVFKNSQPERKSGEWIYDGTKRICPFCKDFIVTGRSMVKYCWNCGARLNERSKDAKS